MLRSFNYISLYYMHNRSRYTRKHEKDIQTMFQYILYNQEDT